MPGWIPTQGMFNENVKTQGTPFSANYNLGVVNLLPNNQPYYVPGSGSSKTYAPGVIPDLSAPPPINPNAYKLGQQHLNDWLNSLYGQPNVPRGTMPSFPTYAFSPAATALTSTPPAPEAASRQPLPGTTNQVNATAGTQAQTYNPEPVNMSRLQVPFWWTRRNRQPR